MYKSVHDESIRWQMLYCTVQYASSSSSDDEGEKVMACIIKGDGMIYCWGVNFKASTNMIEATLGKGAMARML